MPPENGRLFISIPSYGLVSLADLELLLEEGSLIVFPKASFLNVPTDSKLTAHPILYFWKQSEATINQRTCQHAKYSIYVINHMKPGEATLSFILVY